MYKKHYRGEATGRAPFGYTLVPHYAKDEKGNDVYTHSTYELHKENAKIVLGIFEMYAAGAGGPARIAATLNRYKNENGIEVNKHLRDQFFKGLGAGTETKKGKLVEKEWKYEGIRWMIANPCYKGMWVYGETQTAMDVDRGNVVIKVKGENRQVKYHPELAIVPVDLWDKVEEIRNSRKHKKDTRPESGKEKGMLSTVTKCSDCGKSMVLVGGPSIYYYQCRNRKTGLCENMHRVLADPMNSVVTGELGKILNQPDLADRILDLAEKIANEDKPVNTSKELARVNAELNNFLDAIASGNAPKSVLERIKDLEAKKAQLERPQPKPQKITRSSLRNNLKTFPRTMKSNPSAARQAIRELHGGDNLKFYPLGDPNVKPAERSYRIEGRLDASVLTGESFNILGAGTRYSYSVPFSAKLDAAGR